MVFIKNKKALWVILFITLVVWALVFLLFVAGKLSMPILLSCTFVCSIVVFILLLAFFGNYRLNKMQQLSVNAQVVEKLSVRKYERISGHPHPHYAYRTHVFMRFKYTINQNDCFILCEVGKELYDSVNEGQTGMMDMRYNQKHYFFIDFTPDAESACTPNERL